MTDPELIAQLRMQLHDLRTEKENLEGRIKRMVIVFNSINRMSGDMLDPVRQLGPGAK